MSIIEEAIVSCYADMTSLLVMILLLILADRLHKRENASMQILFRPANGEFQVLKYRHNMALAISKMAKYTTREFELHPGDCIFVYTDGAPEATNNAMEMFGEERLVNTLNRYKDAEPEDIIQNVRDAIGEFAGGAPQFDDLTMLCLKFLG